MSVKKSRSKKIAELAKAKSNKDPIDHRVFNVPSESGEEVLVYAQCMKAFDRGIDTLKLASLADIKLLLLGLHYLSEKKLVDNDLRPAFDSLKARLSVKADDWMIS